MMRAWLAASRAPFKAVYINEQPNGYGYGGWAVVDRTRYIREWVSDEAAANAYIDKLHEKAAWFLMTEQDHPEDELLPQK